MNPKHKSLLFKERSCLGWTKFKIIQFIVVTVRVLTPLMSQIVHNSPNFLNKIMADRVARKDMKQGKRFRLSTEVRATLKRKHDRWTPYRAYSRVNKELGVFRALCKIILSFFQDNSMDAVTAESNESKVGCNGKAVKMFAEMIKRSLRNDDFVSHKYTTFNVGFFFTVVFTFNGTICK